MGGGPAPPGGFQGFPPAAVTTLVLQPRTLPVSYEYVGQTAGSKEVEVRARVTGILEQRLFAEGAPVKAGQPLAEAEDFVLRRYGPGNSLVFESVKSAVAVLGYRLHRSQRPSGSSPLTGSVEAGCHDRR